MMKDPTQCIELPQTTCIYYHLILFSRESIINNDQDCTDKIDVNITLSSIKTLLAYQTVINMVVKSQYKILKFTF